MSATEQQPGPDADLGYTTNPPTGRTYQPDHRYDTVLVDVAEHVATLTLNRPEVLNAFSQHMCDEFEDIWRWIRDDDDVHAVVVRAAGDRAFCVGADQKERVF